MKIIAPVFEWYSAKSVKNILLLFAWWTAKNSEKYSPCICTVDCEKQ
jgi:hypothetical protein